MPRLLNFPGFFRSSDLYRQNYGFQHGLRMAVQVRQAHYVAAAGTLVPIEVPGLRSPVMLRARSGDAAVFHQIFGRREVDFDLDASPSFIVDAGAHIGLSSIWLSRRFPEASIVSLEIESGNFSLLKRNTEKYEKITPLNKALWWERTKLKVEDPGSGTWGFRVSDRAEAGKVIQSVTVDDILKESGQQVIDLLKMDIEGAELEMFSRNFESWIDHVAVIAVETHERFRPGCQAAIRDAVEGRGFSETVRGEYSLLTKR
ncbi:MAG: FkbM family methyltransferase [bacterium]|nr:FkbM family methyltransferase [bacterium]